MRFPGLLFVLLGLVVTIVPGGAAPTRGARPVFRRLDGVALTPRAIDATVERLRTRVKVPGLALALIADGKPVYVKAYGLRSVEKQQPLQTDTVMYAASLTKLVFAYTVMQLVDEGKIELDRPITAYLKKPLPEYAKYAELAGDPRWKSLTPRRLLDHTPGFPNFRFVNPDGKLDFKFDPGARYAYSGEGINLLQFVLEEGLGLDVGREMQRRVFDRFGMKRTAMTWRDGASPHDVVYSTQPVTSTSVLSLPLAANGGAAVRVTTQAPTSAQANLAAFDERVADRGRELRPLGIATRVGAFDSTHAVSEDRAICRQDRPTVDPLLLKQSTLVQCIRAQRGGFEDRPARGERDQQSEQHHHKPVDARDWTIHSQRA